jgi:hypothetical protein
MILSFRFSHGFLKLPRLYQRTIKPNLNLQPSLLSDSSVHSQLPIRSFSSSSSLLSSNFPNSFTLTSSPHFHKYSSTPFSSSPSAHHTSIASNSSSPLSSSHYSRHTSSSSFSSSTSSSPSRYPHTTNPALIYFYRQIRVNNFDRAYQIYRDQLCHDSSRRRRNGLPAKIGYLRSLLNICTSEDYCQELLVELEKEGHKLSESEILTLIRLNCSQGKPREAVNSLNRLIEMGASLKLRDFLPIFSYFCEPHNHSLTSIQHSTTNDDNHNSGELHLHGNTTQQLEQVQEVQSWTTLKNLYLAMNLLLSLQKYSLHFEPKQILDLVRVAASLTIDIAPPLVSSVPPSAAETPDTSGSLLSIANAVLNTPSSTQHAPQSPPTSALQLKKFQKKFDQLLAFLSEVHYGLQYATAQEMVSYLTYTPLPTVKAQGILVRDVCQVDGEVVADNQHINGTVLVKYAPPPSILEYHSASKLRSKNRATHSPTRQIPHVPPPRETYDLYTVSSASSPSLVDPVQLITNQTSAGGAAESNAVVCMISNTDSQCSNCGTILETGYLSRNDNEFVRKNLLEYPEMNVRPPSLPPLNLSPFMLSVCLSVSLCLCLSEIPLVALGEEHL